MSVTVVGSLNEDVLVAVERLPGRGETVIGRGAELAPGGKGANQAAAAGRLGPGVHMVGRVGEDPAGDRQLAALAELAGERRAGCTGRRACRPAAPPSRSRTARGENLIVVVPGANARLRPEDADVESVHRATVLLLQLEVPLETVVGGRRGHDRHRRPQPRPRRSRCPPSCWSASTCWCPTSTSWPSWRAAEPGERPPAELAGLARAVAAALGGRHPRRPRRTGRAGGRRRRCCRRPPPVTAGGHHRGRRLLLRRARPGAGAGRRPGRGRPLRGGRGGAVDHRPRRPRARCPTTTPSARCCPGCPPPTRSAERGCPRGPPGTGSGHDGSRRTAMTEPERAAQHRERRGRRARRRGDRRPHPAPRGAGRGRGRRRRRRQPVEGLSVPTVPRVLGCDLRRRQGRRWGRVVHRAPRRRAAVHRDRRHPGHRPRPGGPGLRRGVGVRRSTTTRSCRCSRRGRPPSGCRSGRRSRSPSPARR